MAYNKEKVDMRKYIAIAILGVIASTTASALDVKGNVGYRYDSQEVGNASAVTQDKLKAELALSADVNDKTKVVVGLRTGDAKSAYSTFGGGANLKGIDLNLAYVEYAPIASTKVTFGKMHQPWADSSSFFFDKDIKPEGLAVAFDAGRGLSVNAYSLTIAEGGQNSDSKVKGFQVGLSRDVLGFNTAAFAGVMNQDFAIPNATGVTTPPRRSVIELHRVGASVSKGPFGAFVDRAENDKAALGKDDTALAYGLSYGKAEKPGSWDVSIARQKVEKNSLSGFWLDSDFALSNTQHEGEAVIVNYVVAKGYKVSGKFYNAEVGANKADNKHIMVDLNYTF